MEYLFCSVIPLCVTSVPLKPHCIIICTCCTGGVSDRLLLDKVVLSNCTPQFNIIKSYDVLDVHVTGSIARPTRHMK